MSEQEPAAEWDRLRDRVFSIDVNGYDCISANDSDDEEDHLAASW